MPWKCRLIEKPEQAGQARPGDMWFIPRMIESPEAAEYYTKNVFSLEYLRDHRAHRPPIMVCLPDGAHWLVDQRSRGKESGWTVTGEPPNLTVTPSVVSDGYHGWLTNGELTNDTDGRKYDD